MKGYLNVVELARLLRVKRKTVYVYHTRGDIPRAAEKVGNSPLWSEEQIAEWRRTRPGKGWRKDLRKSDDLHDSDDVHEALAG
jgi:predicted DNA-binding transcriptional regulator AlpA